MGQLERYGLYILVLVIFLILGVAIWGGDPEMPKLDGKQDYQSETNTGDSAVNAALLQNGTPRGASAGSSAGQGSPSEDLGRNFGQPEDASLNRAPSTEVDEIGGGLDFQGEVDDTLVAPPAPAVLVHTIVSGDNPTTIARQYGVPLRALMAANPKIDAAHLQLGKTLRVPAANEASSRATKPKSPRVAGTKTIIVRKGEAPSQVAERVFGKGNEENVQKVLKAAGISDPTKLWAGTKLQLTVN